MWFDERNGRPDWTAAVDHLRACDAVMPGVVERVGDCTLAPHGEPFRTLVLSVFNQQLSVKGAETLFRRFEGRLPGGRVTAKHVLDVLSGAAAWDDDLIRHCGISRQKRSYLVDMAERVLDGRLPLAALADLDDAEATRRLTEVKGIGEWTAQMYLMFVLCRPDVLPTADLGLQDAVRNNYGLPARPRPAEVARIAEAWRPWRTVGTWYLWRAKEG